MKGPRMRATGGGVVVGPPKSSSTSTQHLCVVTMMLICSITLPIGGCESKEDKTGNPSANEGQAAKKAADPVTEVDAITSLVNDYLLYSVYLFSHRESMCSADAIEYLREQTTEIAVRYGLPNAPKMNNILAFPNPNKSYLEMNQQLLVPHIGDEWFELISFAGLTERGKLPSIEFKNLQMQLVRDADGFAIRIDEGAQAKVDRAIFELKNGTWVIKSGQQ